MGIFSCTKSQLPQEVNEDIKMSEIVAKLPQDNNNIGTKSIRNNNNTQFSLIFLHLSVRKVLNAPHRARLPRKQEKVKKNASAQIDTSTIKECLYGHYATCIQIILYFTVIQKIKDCSRILVTIKLLCQSVCRTLSLSFVS